MSLQVTLGLCLIGLGAVSAGGLGLRLPPGDRIAAGLALVVGAGVGLVTLAIGTYVAEGSPAADEVVFLTASALGFVATLGSLALLWRGAERDRRAGGSGICGVTRGDLTAG